MKHILILGGGIAGLGSAWFLKKECKTPLKITLLEKSNRIGGYIKTDEENNVLFEKGPRGFRVDGKGEKTLKLVSGLRLNKELIFADPNVKKRYLLIDKKLRRIPSSLPALLFSPHFSFLLPLLFRERNIPFEEKEDETIADFFCRRFSKEMLSTIIDPFVSGIMAGDAEKLSIQSCFPQLVSWEREYNSIIRGYFRKKEKKKHPSSLCSFIGGMETLTLALARYLQGEGIHIRYDTPASALTFEAGKVLLRANDQWIEADFAISALPLEELKKCFNPIAPLLDKIPTASVVVVNLAFERKPTRYTGYGYLVPSREKEEILGVTFDSDIFPSQDIRPLYRYTVMLGGTKFPQMVEKSPSELLKLARQALANHLGVRDDPLFTQISLAKNAIPQYLLHHRTLLSQIERALPRELLITGSSFYGVGINDCIDHAEKTAKKLNLLL